MNGSTASFLELHERLAQKAWDTWTRPNRPATVAVLLQAAEQEDCRRLAAWEAKRAAWAVRNYASKEKK